MRKIYKNHSASSIHLDWLMISLWILICIISVISFRLVCWVFNNWANLRTDELIYTLSSSLSGTNPFMIRSAVIYSAVPAAICCIILSAILLLIRDHHKRGLFCKITGITAVLITVLSLGYFVYKVQIIQYFVYKNMDSDFIEENYVDPSSVSIEFPETRRNLIFIYVESLETTYSDIEHGGGKTQNIIPELTEIGEDNIMFAGEEIPLNGGYALTGTTYTMGGIFGQTTGLPLEISNMDLSQKEGFLPGIDALGDILQSAGYHNVFFLGTDASFGQRDLYFTDHGDYDIEDYGFAIENGWIPSDYSRNWWGYDDSILYENAKTRLLELSESDQPFNFTLLTVDTHAEDGYICEECDSQFDVQYANVFRCADHQAAEFIRWIQEQDFYENTTIVLTGDHCTMDSDFCNDVPDDYDRKVFTVYINPSSEPVNPDRREYSTLDTFPTTLAAIGVNIEGNRLGLGTNLFSGLATLTEIYGVDYLNQELSKNSTFIETFLGDDLELNIQTNFDHSSDDLIISISRDIINNSDYESIYCIVRHNIENLHIREEYQFEEGDEQITCVIPLEDFFFDTGIYNIEILIKLRDGLSEYFTTVVYSVDMVNHNGLSIIHNRNDDTLTIIYNNTNEYSLLWLPVWRDGNGQEDLVWYTPEFLQADNEVKFVIPLRNHLENGFGTLYIDMYAGEETPEIPLHRWLIDITEE